MKSLLIAHPEPSEAVRIARVLSPSSLTLIATTIAEYETLITDAGFVLIDEKFDGTRFLDVVEQAARQRHLPVMVLTGVDSGKTAFMALRRGARNYVVKTGNYLEILPLSIEETINAYREVEEIRKSNEALRSRVSELETKLKQAGAGGRGQAAAGARAVPFSVPEEVRGAPAADSAVFRDIVASIRSGEITLPTLPTVFVKFRELVAHNAAFDQTAAFLRQDAAISSKLIAVSNSGRFRGAVSNHTLEQALGRLGLVVTQQLVEVICNRALYTSKNPKYVRLVEQIWKHSLCVATAAREIHDQVGVKTEEDPFTLGMLHDIGALVMVQIVGELELKGRFARPLDAVKILQMIESYHCAFGSSVLKRWNFPDSFVSAALFHEDPAAADKRTADLMLTHLADAVARTLGFPGAANPKPAADMSSLVSARELAAQPDVLDRVRDSTKRKMQEFEEHAL